MQQNEQKIIKLNQNKICKNKGIVLKIFHDNCSYVRINSRMISKLISESDKNGFL